MFCKKCGTELQDDDNFCFNCGTPVDKKHEAKNVSEDVIIPEKENMPEAVVTEDAVSEAVVTEDAVSEATAVEDAVTETAVVEDEFLDLNEELVDENVIWEEAPGEELILASDKSDEEFEEVAKTVDETVSLTDDDTADDVVSDDVVVDDVVFDDTVDDVVVDDVVFDDTVDDVVSDDEEVILEDTVSDEEIIVEDVITDEETTSDEIIIQSPDTTETEDVITGVETVDIGDVATDITETKVNKVEESSTEAVSPVIKPVEEVQKTSGPIVEDVDTDVKAKLTKSDVEKSSTDSRGESAVGKLTDKFKKSSTDSQDKIPEVKEITPASRVPSYTESSVGYDEELESKLNIANRDELEEVEYDLEENVNSFTSKVISLLIIILIIIIAVVVGTFLFQSLA